MQVFKQSRNTLWREAKLKLMVQVDRKGARKFYGRYMIDTRVGFPSCGSSRLKTPVTDPMWNPHALVSLLESVATLVSQSAEYPDHLGLRHDRLNSLQQTMDMLHKRLGLSKVPITEAACAMAADSTAVTGMGISRARVSIAEGAVVLVSDEDGTECDEDLPPAALPAADFEDWETV